jgi:ubiquinone biosynthesis protein
MSELGPAAKLREARDGLEALLRIARRLPEFADGIEILAHQLPELIENGIRINDDTLVELAKDTKLGILSGHLAQWVTALALVGIAIGLLI